MSVVPSTLRCRSRSRFAKLMLAALALMYGSPAAAREPVSAHESTLTAAPSAGFVAFSSPTPHTKQQASGQAAAKPRAAKPQKRTLHSGAPDKARPTVCLDYSLAHQLAGCPSQAQLEAAIRSQLTYDPFRDSCELRIQVSLSKIDAERLRADITLSDSKRRLGSRQLESSKGCAELSQTVALTISLAIDPAQVLGTAEPAPSTPSSAPRGAVEAPPAGVREPRSAASSRERSADWIIRSHLGPWVRLDKNGALPGLHVGAGARLRWFRSSLELSAYYPQEQDAEVNGESGTVSVHSFALAALACTHEGPWFACALARGQALRADASGFFRIRRQTLLSWSAGLRLGGELPISAMWAISAAVEGMWVLRRAVITIDDTSVWSTPRAQVGAGVNIVARFE